MKVLMGTTNPAKVKRFEEFLTDNGAEFLTLKDLNITAEPEEAGESPEENARIKAAFYGQFYDKVICNDSGLYFDCIPLDDPRQPGLNIRSPQGHRLNDEEMIEYYSELIHSLGGKTLAYYLDGIAVYNEGKIESYLDERGKLAAFYMVDTPSPNRHEGWPLDSLSINKNTMTYFVDHGNNIYDNVEEQIMVGEYRRRVVEFLRSALGIEQPEVIQVDESLRLRKYDGVYDFALEWYQDEETVYLVDGKKEPYTMERLKAMYEYLNNAGELYFIEVFENGIYRPIGDVTFGINDMPIVIGDRNYRGKKIGRKVISALISRGKELGYEYLELGEIYDWNEASRRCFESLGFRAYEKTEKGSRYRLSLKIQ